MSKILIVSDNEVLNSLYAVNLKIYTDSDCAVASRIEDAIEVIEECGNDISLVISLCMIGGDDAAHIMLHNLVSNGLDHMPMIVIGKMSDVLDEVIVVENAYDIRGVIKATAQQLKITAKDMAEKEVPDYYPMPIRMFFSLKKSPCNVFYRVREEEDFTYHKIFLEGEGIWPKIRDYIDEGVSVLYVLADERFSLAKSVTHQLVDELNSFDENSSASEKLDIVEQGIETVAEQIFDSEVSKEIVELSQKCMDAMQEVVSEMPDLKSLFRELTANKSGYLYSHSIITGFVCEHIVKNTDWGSEVHIEKLKFVLFFHDMYLTSVYKNHPDLTYEDEVIFDDRLSEDEKEIVISHAQEAASALKRYPQCPMGVDAIIRQHHGTSNGLGFQTSFKDNISPLAKVLIIAEAFTEAILKSIRSGEKPIIEDIIKELRTKFNKKSYTKLVDTLENIRL